MLSEVPEGWIGKALGDVCAINMGQSPKSSDVNDEQLGMPFLQGCAEFGDYVPTPKAWITKPLKVAEEGDILFSVRAPVGKMNIAPVQLCIGRGLCAINSESAEQSFLKYLLAYITPKISSQSQGSTFQAVNKKQIHEAPVLLPPRNEQHRIAEILSSVDTSIHATRAVIEQAERVKRGLMEELLTGGLGSEAIERGEVPEGYEAKKLGDLLEGIDGGVSVNSQSEPASLEEKGILKTSCVSNSFFDASENKVVPDEKEIQRLREPVKAETIIFSRMNTPKLVGANAFVPVSHENLFLPDRLWALKPVSKVKSRWLGFYMSYLFSSGVFEALGTGTSGSMKNISKSKLKDVSIVVPSEVEQARVAEILSSVDGFVAKQKAIVEQYARTKRGLMDDLLTGKVRTV